MMAPHDKEKRDRQTDRETDKTPHHPLVPMMAPHDTERKGKQGVREIRKKRLMKKKKGGAENCLLVGCLFNVPETC